MNYYAEIMDIISWIKGIILSEKPKTTEKVTTSNTDTTTELITTTEKITFGECEAADDTTGLFAVSILTDNFPEETTWQVQDMCDGRNKVLTGGSYDAASTVYDIAEKLPPSRYKFIIKDKEEDGIYSDDYGYGSYSVYWEGDLVKEGGEFGKDERTVFGLGSCP